MSRNCKLSTTSSLPKDAAAAAKAALYAAQVLCRSDKGKSLGVWVHACCTRWGGRNSIRLHLGYQDRRPPLDQLNLLTPLSK
eukprot:scaffold443732_cov38-Prasinocladus_malaysianus.AAC.1